MGTEIGSQEGVLRLWEWAGCPGTGVFTDLSPELSPRSYISYPVDMKSGRWLHSRGPSHGLTQEPAAAGASVVGKAGLVPHPHSADPEVPSWQKVEGHRDKKGCDCLEPPGLVEAGRDSACPQGAEGLAASVPSGLEPHGCGQLISEGQSRAPQEQEH